jgi:hypothetical protein
MTENNNAKVLGILDDLLIKYSNKESSYPPYINETDKYEDLKISKTVKIDKNNNLPNLLLDESVTHSIKSYKPTTATSRFESIKQKAKDVTDEIYVIMGSNRYVTIGDGCRGGLRRPNIKRALKIYAGVYSDILNDGIDIMSNPVYCFDVCLQNDVPLSTLFQSLRDSIGISFLQPRVFTETNDQLSPGVLAMNVHSDSIIVRYIKRESLIGE